MVNGGEVGGRSSLKSLLGAQRWRLSWRLIGAWRSAKPVWRLELELAEAVAGRPVMGRAALRRHMP